MAAIYYRFKTIKGDYTVNFDGMGMPLAELKRQIVQQGKMSAGADFDLKIVNAQTNEEYTDESTMVPRGTSVVVMRVPASKPGGILQTVNAASMLAPSVSSSSIQRSMNTEDDRLAAMRESQSAWSSSIDQSRARRPGGIPPPHHTCHRCGEPGHYANSCPTLGNADYDVPRVRKSTGIPKSFLQAADAASGTGVLLGDSGFVRAVPQSQEWERHASARVAATALAKLDEIRPPAELECPICHKLLSNATKTPCCSHSFCDKCIRDYLLENSFTCFRCKSTNVAPDRLTPNEPARRQVEAFRQQYLAQQARLASSAAAAAPAQSTPAQPAAQPIPTAASAAAVRPPPAVGSESARPLQSREHTPPVHEAPPRDPGPPRGISVFDPAQDRKLRMKPAATPAEAAYVRPMAPPGYFGGYMGGYPVTPMPVPFVPMPMTMPMAMPPRPTMQTAWQHADGSSSSSARDRDRDRQSGSRKRARDESDDAKR